MSDTIRVGIDVGGTFTDLLALAPDGTLVRFKVSTTPRAPEEGALAVFAAFLATIRAPSDLALLAHASTIATNALLGQLSLELPRVAFITTAGFRDVVEIGRQNRSAIYDLNVRRPIPLARREDRLTVRERREVDGSVSVAPNLDDVDAAIETLAERGIRSVAIGFLHADVDDTHEALVAKRIAARLPHVAITRSAELAREYREYERFSTAVVNAALLPIVRGYLERFALGVRAAGVNAPLFMMRSDGGMSSLEAAAQRPAALIESGPASGVIAAAYLGRVLGEAKILSFDMGGTTAKAGAILDGTPEIAREFEAAGTTHSGRAMRGSGYPVRFPFIDLAEVSAGGGTLATRDSAGSLCVGPSSAGADPGPAAYGKGEHATVTDADIVLGRLDSRALLGGTFPIDARRARRALASLARDDDDDALGVAAGVLALVDTEMAKVLRIVSVERGYDPRDFTLVAFGGGGPLHACAVAREIGVRRIVIPALPGLFSAYGLLAADVRVSLARSLVTAAGEDAWLAAERTFEALASEADAALASQNVALADRRFVREADLRYVGQSFELAVPWSGDFASVLAAFHDAHERRYGFAARDERVALVTVRVVALGLTRKPRLDAAVSSEPHAPSAAPRESRPVWNGTALVTTAVYDRDELTAGTQLAGPVVIEQYDTTTYVAPGWSALVDPYGNLALTAVDADGDASASASADADANTNGVKPAIDAVTATIVASSLAYASEEMGIAIRNAAYSPNIKERLDHSCAILDRSGRLIAQAEHIPVHLGSLPWGLRRVLAWLESHGLAMAPGDQWVVNDPYLSGTHLNDVTVIRPVFFRGRLYAYAANKAHHADVGGSAPGSMPPDARDLYSEGFIAPPMLLVAGDRILAATVELFRSNSRTPEARSGDLRAQVAGNVIGERRLLELFERYGTQTFELAVEHALDTSERRMRAALGELPDGEANVSEVLEDRSGDPSIHLRLRLLKSGDSVALDYAGTSAQTTLPLNAVYGVTLSGVYYALRALTDPTIPMNEGVFRPIEVSVPEGTLLHPRRPAPVSGGNVETSMRNADLVLSAFAALAPGRVPAQSGGSMNNVVMGGIDRSGAAWSFYETNACGMGARPNADGIDGIHAHMTNTLNTPIEAVEREFPLRVTRYEFAEGSGGSGLHRGGAGLIRGLQLRDGSATVSLLAERHRVAPRGACGGRDGATGVHTLERDGVRSTVAAKTTFALQPGDTIEIVTAGGGGYGVPDAST